LLKRLKRVLFDSLQEQTLDGSIGFQLRNFNGVLRLGLSCQICQVELVVKARRWWRKQLKLKRAARCDHEALNVSVDQQYEDFVEYPLSRVLLPDLLCNVPEVRLGNLQCLV